MAVEVDAGPHKQITGQVVLGHVSAVRLLVGLLNSCPLQEFTTNDACKRGITRYMNYKAMDP